MNALPTSVAITWTIDDVLYSDDTLTPEDAACILQRAKRYHSAEYGVNIDIIDGHIMAFLEANPTRAQRDAEYARWVAALA